MRSVGFIFRFGEDSKNHSLDSRIQFGKHSPLNNSSFFIQILKESRRKLFSMSGVMDICQIYVSQILTRIHNKMNIHRLEHEYETRHHEEHQRPRPRIYKRIVQRRFSYLTPRICDMLPEDLK